MRLILKILLFPVILLLTIFVAVCQFLCTFSTMLLSIVAMLIFLIALGTMLILKEVAEGFKIMALAYLISPYGIPLFASWLVEKVDDWNCWLKEI
ncbi:MAG: CD1845 family protein [Proteiniphilum sp.]|nr:CD1845 family protein [Proteiniphilum sp.]MDD3908602.1 CD1845 family protein [Proteiniphilum sp.]MDD4415929.1 CD1845 family protein [Proteiniphilum sp.]